MEKLQGKNYCFAKDKLPENAVSKINEEIGIISKQLTQIRNDEFGFLGDTKRYSSLFEFTKIMLTNLIKDAEQRDIDIVYHGENYLKQLDNDRIAFEGISPATLVHWGLWEGNVFIDNGHVSGIIDWERALWGEAFMDDRFRKPPLSNSEQGDGNDCRELCRYISRYSGGYDCGYCRCICKPLITI